MYFVALAADYDGTIATHGAVDGPTIEALQRLKASGRRLLLVSGRELHDLQHVFPHLKLFDLVVAENGALLFDPKTGAEEPLAEAPSVEFVARLQALEVTPLSVGRCIVATWQPHEDAVLGAIRELGLESQIIFNKGAVMVLPPGVNKATGLQAALKKLHLSAHNVVGIGDAENDHAFLHAVGCAAAVANALPSVKERADLVTEGDHGKGVAQLVQRMVDTDMRSEGLFVSRHRPLLAVDEESGDAIHLQPFAGVTLVAGVSGGGKSTIVAGLLERLREACFQFCVVDPEGDYDEIEDAVVLGSAKQAPPIDEVLSLLSRPDVSVVVNMLALDMPDRPRFFAQLLPELSKMRARTGRPHWLVIDEAHHMLPAGWEPARLTLPQELPATVLVTVHPDQLAAEVFEQVERLVAVGKAPHETLAQFAAAIGVPPPKHRRKPLENGCAYLMDRRGQVRTVLTEKPAGARRRHARKYADGDLGQDKSFYFRGPRNALNLRVQNLSMFVQIAEGVDDRTWLHHLREGDYSRWFRDAIKDEAMADEAAEVERGSKISAAESRALIKELIDRRYTAPARVGASAAAE